MTEQMVSVPDTSTLFMARRGELRLVRKPIRQTRDAEGLVADTLPGETLEFHDGVLRIPPRGNVRLADNRECNAAELIAWLEGHPLKGDVEEGFWRVDPTAPAPSEAELERLQDLAMELDADGLGTFIRQEREGWDRVKLIEVAERTLEKVRAKITDSELRREDALEAARKEGERRAAEHEGDARPRGKG